MAMWRILWGVHSDSKHFKLVRASSEIEGVERKPNDGVFYKGDIIETDLDLSRFNRGIRPRFKRLESLGDDLDGMTRTALEGLAASEDVELPVGARKADIVRAIRAARGAPVTA